MRVTCRNLSKVFHTRAGEIVALSGVEFDVRHQEFVSIVGPSGCGKTTLLRIVAGLLAPTTGAVVYEGVEPGVPRNAMVFQEDSVFPWMTVIDNVAFPLELLGIGRGERLQIARSYLSRVGLERFAHNYPRELSTGMKQRVGIARAFARTPAMLLMDEPFGALDPQMKAVLQEQLVELWAAYARTVLYVTHDIEEALFLGDRVLIMSGSPGRIKADIPVPFPRPRHHGLRADPRFVEMKEEIWTQIRDEVLAVLEGRR
jgi:NitT/TauT family transport system ATP-binding protein